MLIQAMNRWSLRQSIRQYYHQQMLHALQPYDEQNLSRSAIVFSPHPDDETLGCGGMIIRKRQAGADVKIIFMTDGCRSHAHLMPASALRVRREQEAIAAAHALGIERQHVLFLGVTDHALQKAQALVVPKIVNALQQQQPQEIFIPYRAEGPSDHYFTHQFVRAALQQGSARPLMYEYPIWFWHHWPQMQFTGDRRSRLRMLKQTMLAGFGARLVRDFQCSISIKAVLEQKRHALQQHRSQMERWMSNPDWLTLGDIANGEFLNCFFQEYEFFHHYRFGM
jgi:LmbE family N-acetylglucosaminyl deacetylase